LIECQGVRDDGTEPTRNGPLVFCLEWFNEGTFYRTRGSQADWSKSSMQEDLLHAMEAIIEGLDEHLQWPDQQQHMEGSANQCSDIFHGCIGIADDREYDSV